MLLAPVLEPAAIESAIASVLDRLAPDGEVAHEEDIGEFAVLRNAREGRGRVATPIYDYGMVDDDFMLAPLAAALDAGRSRAGARGRAHSWRAKGADAASDAAPRWRAISPGWSNARAAFASDPRATNLVGIKPGRMTGNWRDSEQGLGRGRYPYDVNAALVPAALDAAARLVESRPAGFVSERRAAPRLVARRRTARGPGPRMRRRDCSRSTCPPTGARADISRVRHRDRCGCASAACARRARRQSLTFHALVAGRAGARSSDPEFRRGIPAAVHRARRPLSSSAA